jgi:hypothetical protein
LDYKTYRDAYFVKPEPETRFESIGIFGMSLYFWNYTRAVNYYSHVLGPPPYVEGNNTRGWRFGQAWLTLFPSIGADPQNMDLQILMRSAKEAEELQAAFIDAGGKGPPPSDEMMYERLRFCAVQDPFGTDIVIVSKL